ncbi:hypothetical protein B0H16DRAFT_1723687 [Mycena metata]|uniref:Uncharacterized protein n=1 Tax=Mycena metata TaxID=1033252 RepID=A0AAD7IXC0_9AGAR|nr:hypothetical protein B0H16DRAFT_1723687 [Mycena metata]
MARTAKALPPGVELNTHTKQVRCLACKEADPINLGRWIERKSLDGHLKPHQHRAHVESLAQRDRDVAETALRLEEAYSGASTLPVQSPSTDPSPTHRAEMYENEPFIQPSWAEYEAAGLNAPVIPSFMTRTAHEESLEAERLKEQVAQMLAQFEDGKEEDDDDTLENTINTFKDLDLETEQDEIDPESYFNTIPMSKEYVPYPNKVSMLLDILDNLPRLRMSSNQLKMILWILTECNVLNVPSYAAFRAMQDRLRILCGSEPKAYTSSNGNRFFVNDVRESVARDFANPEIAKHLNFYPEETSGPNSEVWQAERWKEYKPSELTPMYARGLRQFYIEEVAELDNGKMVIPLAWVKGGGILCADCYEIKTTVTGWESVLATEFRFNYHDILERVGDKIKWADGANAPEMPNPLPDNVSGNKSKQYNKHMNMYMANSNLPGRLLQQENFVRFVSTSPHAGSPERFSAIKEQIQGLRTQTQFHVTMQRHVDPVAWFYEYPAFRPITLNSQRRRHIWAEMPTASVVAAKPVGHMTTLSPTKAGLPRFAAQTKQNLEEQIKLAMYGVEAPISKLQTATGVKDKVAQYWINILLEKVRQMKADSPEKTPESIAKELQKWLDEQPGLDPNRDTPVELLHTILLGIIKYVWHILYTTWSEAEQNLFVVRLQSTDIDGLTIPPIRAAYMMQYKNGLIGKHFKSLMQTMVFHMHGLVSPELFTLVKAVSASGSVLWVHEIDNMSEYTEHLIILIANVLDAFGDNDPAKILLKVKLHLLTHIPDDAVRFGPLIRNSTEVFECFNTIFRLCSILSNHQAPSRDIAYKFASMDCVKHILSGGFWKQGDGWVQAATNVRVVLQTMPIIQRHLGWAPQRKTVTGAMHFAAKKKSPPVSWDETHSASSSNVLADCRTSRSWVFARDNDNTLIIGRIIEILASDGGSKETPAGLVTLENFTLSEVLHPDFDMPVLRRPIDHGLRLITVLSTAVSFRFSAAHDCRQVQCEPTASRPVVQERQETSKSTVLIAHKDDNHFCINMAALHNATLLRRALPIALTVPRPLYMDRKSHHHQLAAGLRVSQVVKRARTQEKRKATMAANAAAKQRGKAVEEEPEVNDDVEEEEEEEEEESRPPPKKRKRSRKKT